MLSIKNYLLEKKIDVEKDKKEGLSLLDSFADPNSNINLSDFKKIFVPNGPMIYAFITPKVKDAIKVGFTDQAPERRIDQWRQVYDDETNKLECIGYWSSEEFNEVAKEKQFFWDHAVHKKLSGRGFHQFTDAGEFYNYIGDELHEIHHSREFFRKYSDLTEEEKDELSEKILEDLINKMKQNIKEGRPDFKIYSSSDKVEANDVWNKPDTYSNTALQEEAILNGVNAIKDGKTKLLMAAVMRFGKTHAAYEIVRRAGLKTVLVTSAKADVRAAWRADINHKRFIDTFVFVELVGGKLNISKYNKESGFMETYKNVIQADLESYIDPDSILIIFDTLHDLGGSIKELKAKHANIFNRQFDIMIVDEAHYGSHANLFGRVTGLNDIVEEDDTDLEKEDNKDINNAKKDANIIKDLSKNCKIMLEVSGTPYYILATNEFLNNDDTAIISKVGYTDMLKARDEWENTHPRKEVSSSPYFGIPTLHKIGLKLTKSCVKAMNNANNTDSLSALFKVKDNKFINEHAIIDLMKNVFGDDSDDTIGFLKNKEIEGTKTCKHTMMVLPMCKHCHIMKELLINNNIIDPKEREIIVIVSSTGHKSDINSSEELNKRLVQLDESNKKSLVITVKKYLTGVSMPLLDSMLYMKNANSPQEYDQAIFRLCTRNVQKFDHNGRKISINKKHNVYLIDFNMSNMMTMMTNSAQMKALAENNPTPERIKEIMNDDLKVTPIFCEDTNGDILGKMKSLQTDDLMKIYTNYQENKSISDIVDDDCKKFDLLFMSKSFQNMMNTVNIKNDKSKKSIPTNNNPENEEDLDNFNNNSDRLSDTVKQEIANGQPAKDKKNKDFKNAMEKFKTFIKGILYSNICMDIPFTSIDELIKNEDNKEIIDFLDDFDITMKDIKLVYNSMPTKFQQLLNAECTKISILANDLEKSDYAKFKKSIEGMGALSKAEHATPDTLIEKMCNKLSKADFDNANSILLPTEKEGEFFTYIYHNYGKNVAEKCKIVPTSRKALQLCRKALKSVGMKDYINNIIINIEDKNKNKFLYDDFLNIINEGNIEQQILNSILLESQKEFLDKYNMGKKFDITIQNPPYDKNLHLKFLEKVIEISNTVVSIQPVRWLEEVSSWDNPKSQFNKFNNIRKHIKNLEFISSKRAKELFDAIFSMNLGIYVCDENGGFDCSALFGDTIYDKVKQFIHKNLCTLDHNKKDGWRIRIPMIAGGKSGGSGERPPVLSCITNLRYFYDGKKDGKPWYDFYQKNQHSKTTPEITLSIKIDSETQAKNFCNQFETDFVRYIENILITDVNISEQKILWMANIKNPRTGKLGYDSDWIDEDFDKVFNLSDDEINRYHKFIADYTEEFNEWKRKHGRYKNK